jgi:hypothetical protein
LVAMSLQEQRAIKPFFRITPKSFPIGCIHSAIMPEHDKQGPGSKLQVPINNRISNLSVSTVIISVVVARVYSSSVLVKAQISWKQKGEREKM